MEPHDDCVKMEVNEEPLEEQVCYVFRSSSPQQTPKMGSFRECAEDVFHCDTTEVKEEEVCVKDEPLENQDILSINTTTFYPELSSRPRSTRVCLLFAKREKGSMEASPRVPKFKRGCNWSPEMELHLLYLIDENKHTVYSKRFSSAVSVQDITAAWVSIANSMNAAFPCRTPLDRTAVQKKWWALKKKGRDEIHHFRKESSASGGGPAPTPLSAIGKGVLAILGSDNTSISGIAEEDDSDSAALEFYTQHYRPPQLPAAQASQIAEVEQQDEMVVITVPPPAATCSASAMPEPQPTLGVEGCSPDPLFHPPSSAPSTPSPADVRAELDRLKMECCRAKLLSERKKQDAYDALTAAMHGLRDAMKAVQRSAELVTKEKEF